MGSGETLARLPRIPTIVSLMILALHAKGMGTKYIISIVKYYN